jgi:CheY-like chemotaxis protein/HPt (histidine-containing phosphotransfer) domain-containing protein
MKENILQNKKVLVAEDNVINQMVVKHSLAKLGATTDIAGDGNEAIEKMKAATYDLVLMDIQMPIMDGYEATGFIRNQLKSTVPIIAMTAFALKGEDEKCYECGMNGYVSKPFTLDSLYNAIQNVFQLPYSVNTNPNILGNKEVAIDLSMLYEIAGTDPAYINMMISTFLENMPATIDKIEANFQIEDWENLYRSAHYAKSSLSVIKIADMYDWVTRIEQSAKKKIDLAMLPELIEQVKQKFVIVEKILSEKFSLKIKSTLA